MPDQYLREAIQPSDYVEYVEQDRSYIESCGAHPSADECRRKPHVLDPKMKPTTLRFRVRVGKM